MFFSPSERKDCLHWQRPLQGCQIFLCTTRQKGKNIPNIHKIYLKATNYIKWQ
jgi:hypothetical protein